MTEPVIGPEQHWALWAILLATAAFALWAERTRIGGRLSGAVIAIAATFALSNLGVIPAAAPAYDIVWAYLVPLAIPLLLLKADIRRIIRESGPTLIAFSAGAAGSVLGTLLAARLAPLGEEGWKMAGVFCATYVGGSINYMAVARALDVRSADLLTAGLAADNLVMTLLFLILFALPHFGWLRRRLTRERAAGVEDGPRSEAAAVAPFDLALALALAAGMCAIGFALAAAFGAPVGGVLILTALAVALATLFPRRMARVAGAQELGVLLMQVFFAALGASANIAAVVRVGPRLFLFAAIILTVHLAVVIAAAFAFRLDLTEAVIGSNANIGGPTTAAAMAAANGWHALVIPAVLCGTLGYAVASFVGVAVATWLR